jgi:UV excision repair protein RAD23
MKVTIKTLDNNTFQLNVENTDTILSVKKKIEETTRCSVPSQRLIHTGKILEDNSLIKDYNIKETDFLVLMISKQRPQQAAPPTPVTPPPSSQLPNQASVSPTTPSQTPPNLIPKAVAPNQPRNSRPQVAQPPDELIARVMELGFKRKDVIAALQVTNNNVDRAVDYLTNADDSFDEEEEEDDEGADFFEALRNNPQFQTIRQNLATDPNLAQPLLQELMLTNPDLANQILNNQEQFFRLLNLDQNEYDDEFDDEGGEAPMDEIDEGMFQSPEDREAISRLENMGFKRDAVIEAYFACDKDEKLAADYLCESLFEVVEEGESDQE